MPVGTKVHRIVSLGRLPSDNDEYDELALREWTDALDALDEPLTDDEAIALLDCFPSDESTTYGLAWTVLHAIESAPYGPALLAALDNRSWWVTYLRERAERGGLV